MVNKFRRTIFITGVLIFLCGAVILLKFDRFIVESIMLLFIGHTVMMISFLINAIFKK